MKKKLIIQSKDILGGTPVFAGTRVPAKAFIDYLEAGRALDEFLDDFPSVKRSQAIAFLELVKTSILGRSHARAS